MIKCVCDLCGKDAPEASFIVPYWEKLIIMNRGKQIGTAPPQLTSCKMNLCREHQGMIASVIEAFQQEKEEKK